MGGFDTFEVKTTVGDFEARSVILATGSRRASARIPGVKEFEGKGVSYCAVCDAFFYRGKEVAVLGNSDFALHEAEELSHTASRVTIFTDGKKPEFSRENPLPVNTMKIQAIEGDERVSGIRLKSDVSMQEAGTGADSFVPAEGVFVALGTAGSSEMARQIGAELNEKEISGSMKRWRLQFRDCMQQVIAPVDFSRWQKLFMTVPRQDFPPVSMCGSF